MPEGCSTTVSRIVSDRPSGSAALSVVTPAFFAVTLPFWSTSAMELSPVDQMTVASS